MISNVIGDGATFGNMASKRLERRYLENVAKFLDEIVRKEFGNNQRAAARGLRISQAHVSHILKAEGRGPGLSVLIRLREHTGKSIDEILGLAPLGTELPPDVDRQIKDAVRAEVAEMLAEIAKRSDPPPSTRTTKKRTR